MAEVWGLRETGTRVAILVLDIEGKRANESGIARCWGRAIACDAGDGGAGRSGVKGWGRRWSLEGRRGRSVG